MSAAHTEKQPVTTHTLKNNQLPPTHWGTSRYYAYTEKQAVTMFTEEQPGTLQTMKNKQVPSANWRTTSYHAHTEEHPITMHTLKNKH